jgi:polyvinyl alcohol dehydrogenase (cytochrome)
MLAINTTTGNLIWGKRVHWHGWALVTMSPTIWQNSIYFGVSSLEELVADQADYPCCTFIGEVQRRSLITGNLEWRTLMAPDNGNQTGRFSGNSVWGSAPAIDPARGLVYFATGNNYEVSSSSAF